METRKKILLVDDEEEALHFLGNILKRENYNVTITPKGKEAIELAKSIKPDLVILDVLMPDMDGADVAFALENDPITKDTPIIFLTGILTKDEEFSGKKSSRHFTLAKPITKEELLTAVRRVLPF